MKKENPYKIEFDEEVAGYIEKNGDFRVCTDCGGPVIVPVETKRPKKSDYMIEIGTRKLYVSINLLRWGLEKITMEDFLRKSCGL